jgi:alpha-L-fucosidase
LKEFGAVIHQRYGNNLAGKHLRATAAEEPALDGNPDTFWSAPTGSHHAVLEVRFPRPITFDHTLTMEWLNVGQHIQQYAIEVFKEGKWIEVSRGHAIGHKRIDSFPPVTASRVRLSILSSTAEAHIREFQLFEVGDTIH